MISLPNSIFMISVKKKKREREKEKERKKKGRYYIATRLQFHLTPSLTTIPPEAQQSPLLRWKTRLAFARKFA